MKTDRVDTVIIQLASNQTVKVFFMGHPVQPECVVCVRVMFNSHYSNFLVYTFQIWSDKKETFLIL